MASIYESPEIIGAFIDEAEEQLQLLENSILDLEQNGETTENIQRIFRVAHTLKGSSSAMGFEKMKTLTHEMENVLDQIRNNKLTVSRKVIDALLQCKDNLRFLKEDFLSDQTHIGTDITSSLYLLEQISLNSQASEEDNTNQICDSVEEQKPFSLDLERQILLEQAADCGIHCSICKFKILERSQMKSTRALLILNYFNQLGTVVDTNPNILELPDDTDLRDFSMLLLTQLDPKSLESKAKEEVMDVESIQISPYRLDHKKMETANKDRCSTTPSPVKSTEVEKKVTQTVRVDVERLEQMMNLVGELVIEQTRIAQVSNVLYNRYSSDGAVDDLLGISNHVSRVISELQEGVMKARMLPIQQLFNRFPRMVRDLSLSLGKDIDLVIEGGETEMDRTIIEDINDPLIHIIRNAIDHGIETEEKRRLAGKPTKGTLRITAHHQENHVIIAISDDGAGINAQKLKESAVRKNIISQQEADSMSDQDAINLIFQTGFSTAEVVSDVSGRGVGMDIVRNHIDKLNGIIDVESKPGSGTKFIIKLPLTLAILTGLLVKLNDDTFALPMSNVLEIVRIPEGEIDSIKGQAVAVIREKVLPLVWLHDYFNIHRKKRSKNVFIVVLGVAEKRLGLVVDELIGNQEIVVKPLGSYIGKVEGCSGATILGDGSVACILDVVGVAKMVGNRIVSESI